MSMCVRIAAVAILPQFLRFLDYKLVFVLSDLLNTPLVSSFLPVYVFYCCFLLLLLSLFIFICLYASLFIGYQTLFKRITISIIVWHFLLLILLLLLL